MTPRSCRDGLLLIPDPLDLVAGHLLPAAVVELRRACIGVVLGHLDRAAVLQEDGDAGRWPAVVADRRRDPRLLGAPLEHAPSVLLAHVYSPEATGTGLFLGKFVDSSAGGIRPQHRLWIKRCKIAARSLQGFRIITIS